LKINFLQTGVLLVHKMVDLPGKRVCSNDKKLPNMLLSYCIIAWRNWMKNKVYSFINLFGLTLGLTCCLLIALYLHYETGYDRYHVNGKNVYQLAFALEQKGSGARRQAQISSPFAAALKQEYPEITAAARLISLFDEDKTLLQYSTGGEVQKALYETDGFLADPSFFTLFTYHFTEGDAATALSMPNSVVLCEATARKVFGSQPALNKTIHISSNTNGEHDFLVTGVFRPSAQPSHINGHFFMSIAGGGIDAYIRREAHNFATDNMCFTYLQLQPGASARALERKFPGFIRKYAADDLKQMGFNKRLFLIPVKDIHLYQGIQENVSPSGNRTYLYMLASIALFTLLIACINFMNLATARSSHRSAEVGIRKVLGAEKKMLVAQFLGESVLMTLLAFVFSLAFTSITLPLFNQIAGREISFSFSQNKEVLAAFLVLAVVTGLFAGSYPAWYLSSFKPARVLKGVFASSLAVVSLRKILVVFQFVVSVVLIVASVVIGRQLHYLRHTDLGFTRERQLVIPLRSAAVKNRYVLLKKEIDRQSQVLSTAACMYYPGLHNMSDNHFYRNGQTMTDARRLQRNWVDADWLHTLSIPLVAGRLFSPQFPGDTTSAVIVNEEAVRQIGFASAEKAVGNHIYYDRNDSTYRFTIIGVVKDFHFEDLHARISPYSFMLTAKPANFNYLIVHTGSGDPAAVIAAIRQVWQQVNAAEPFEYSFLDADFQRNYEAEGRLAALVNYFTVMAILISCLGLFGLATFSAEQRTKEIGVRKVLGASVTSIVVLLSKDFLKLVLIAILIASPLAWLIMHQWLQDFAYQIHISWLVFVLTSLIALLVAVVTISLQAVKAAVASPVKSLRTE
jgi:putative ABC transport system permease protein